MYSIVHSAGSAAAASIWPIIVFLGVVTVVTVVALCRAERDDIPRIFASFAGAFGFHKLSADDEVADAKPEQGAAGNATDSDRQGEIA